MAKRRYCPLCERYIPAKKKFSWPFFFLTFSTYVCWYIIKPRNVCPICGSGGLLKQDPNAIMKHKEEIEHLKEMRKAEKEEDARQLSVGELQ